MTYEYYLVWYSQYGNEEIDCFETREEAEKMKAEYQLAFGEGYIKIWSRGVYRRKLQSRAS